MKGSSSQWLVLSYDEMNFRWTLFCAPLSSLFFGGEEVRLLGANLFLCYEKPLNNLIIKHLKVIFPRSPST